MPRERTLPDRDDDDFFDDDDDYFDRRAEEDSDDFFDGDETPADLANLPPLTVTNDDPSLLGFLRGATRYKAAPLPLSDYLREHADPRADAAQDLLSARAVLPAAPPPWNFPFTLVASAQWGVILSGGRVIATAYPMTELSRHLSVSGRCHVAVRSRPSDRTAETVLAAVEKCRLRLLLTLFDLEEADLRVARGGSLAGRAHRLARSLRRTGRRALPRICAALSTDCALGAEVLRILAKQVADRALWTMVMDALNPNWRDGVVPGTR